MLLERTWKSLTSIWKQQRESGQLILPFLVADNPKVGICAVVFGNAQVPPHQSLTAVQARSLLGMMLDWRKLPRPNRCKSTLNACKC